MKIQLAVAAYNLWQMSYDNMYMVIPCTAAIYLNLLYNPDEYPRDCVETEWQGPGLPELLYNKRSGTCGMCAL